MHEVIAIGSALVDIYIQSRDFELKQENSGVWLCQRYDEKLEVDSFVVNTGGGGSNTAVGFARLGFQTGAVAELGVDTWSQVVLTDFEREGVDTSFLIKERKEETGGSVILAVPGGGRTIMVHRGAASMLDAKDIPEYALSQAGWVHLSSIAGRQEALTKIFRVVSQNRRRFSWNPGKAEIKLLTAGQLKLGALSIEVLFANQQEWASLESVQAQLHQQCKQIVVTRGAEGGEVYQAGQLAHRFPGARVEAVNGTGAGDSFAVGYVVAILSGRELANQASWGVKNAGSVIQQVGAKAGLLTREEMLQ